MAVKIYTTTTCPYCRLAKAYLTKKKIPFTEINVTGNRAAAEEMVKKSGQYGVPVLDIHGTIIIGYDPEAIDTALKN
jgi:glutaredoxin-like YruB-family protein